MRRDVYQAIADPTRRQIIAVLAGKSLTLNNVADSFGISRQAVSKHIKILTECGLVAVTDKGRERHCQATLQPLHEVAEWINHYRQFYEAQLDSLENYLATLQTKNKKHGKRKK
ncbi:MAG TPA: metalloregulator ArsR/SmtB family transcription factor [Chitinophagaceae bacterium]|nr:metalloregulator ArsR/SmtB family transcription factor [Chitinophagaceae bacterium]